MTLQRTGGHREFQPEILMMTNSSLAVYFVLLIAAEPNFVFFLHGLCVLGGKEGLR